MAQPYEIRLLQIAEEDLTEQINYIAADNPAAAENLLNKIESAFQLLAANPKLGRVPRDADLKAMGYRIIVLKKWVCLYKIETHAVIVHRFLRAARDYKSLL